MIEAAFLVSPQAFQWRSPVSPVRRAIRLEIIDSDFFRSGS
jgi:hypothetical protein